VYNYVHIGCSMVYLGNIRIIFDFEGQLWFIMVPNQICAQK
jgi:hypothetical protein